MIHDWWVAHRAEFLFFGFVAGVFLLTGLFVIRAYLKEYVGYLKDRYVLGHKNIGWGWCRWNCSYRAIYKQRIILDEGMCRDCHEIYIEDEK